MQKFLLILAVLGIVAGTITSQIKQRAKDALNPEVISNPTYAEIHVTMGRAEGVMLAKTADPADCDRFIQNFNKASNTKDSTLCPECRTQSTECKSTLAPRNLRLFDDQPTHVNYLSLSRGDRVEREMRMIYWGVTLEESESVCALAATLQKERKGTVNCIRAKK